MAPVVTAERTIKERREINDLFMVTEVDSTI
jgi:hypothetical protein